MFRFCFKKLLKNTKGITLVELLVYMGISSILIVVISRFLGVVVNEGLKVQNYSAVQSDGMYIPARIKADVLRANDLVLPASLGDTSDKLQLMINGTLYNYYLLNGKLYLNDGSGDYLISSPYTIISDLSFTRTGNVNGKPVVVVSFVSSGGYQGSFDYEREVFNFSVGLR